LAQWGFGNAVATLGTACTADHAHKLFRFTDQVVFSFDGDAAGRRAAGRALEAVLPHATDTRRVSFLFLPAEHDPDSYIREHGPEAFEACVKKAVPLSKQVLEHASADCDMDSAEGRARLLVQAIPLIAQFPEGALRGLIADELATMAKTSSDEVRRRLGEHQQAAQAHAQRLQDRARPGEARARAASSDHGDWGGDMGDIPAFEPDGGDHGLGHDFGTEPAYEAAYEPPYERGNRGEGRRRDGKPWTPRKGGYSGSRWQSQGSPVPARPLPQAATPLDRIVWALASNADLWEQLPAATHDLLCEQSAPYGDFFRWLDRLLLDQGVLPAEELTRLMREGEAQADGSPSPAGGHFVTLAQRIAKLLDVPDNKDTVENLLNLIKPLELIALRDELELLTQSGELSEAAEARKMELMRLTLAMKLEISQNRPISG
jgi:DNA primase